jgi:hypothetical protein
MPSSLGYSKGRGQAKFCLQARINRLRMLLIASKRWYIGSFLSFFSLDFLIAGHETKNLMVLL